MPAVIGAAGAIGLNIAMGFAPIPANFKTGWLGTAVKVGLAIIGGQVAGRVVGRNNGRLMTAGAITVLAYDALKQLLQTALPNVPLGEYISGYMNTDSGGYARGLGYPNAAQYAGDQDQLDYFQPGMVAPYGNSLPAGNGNGAQMGEYISGGYGDPAGLSYATGY